MAWTLEGDKHPLETSLCTAENLGFWKRASPARAMAFISEGSLGLRCSLRLDTEEDFPRLKKERQLPTGDFFILLGGLFLGRESGTHGWRGVLQLNSGCLLSALSAFCSGIPGFCLETPSFPQLRMFSFFQLSPKVLLCKFSQPLQSSCSAGEERPFLV